MRLPLMRRSTADRERLEAIGQLSQTYEGLLDTVTRQAVSAEGRLTEWSKQFVERFEAYPDYARDARVINVLVSNHGMYHLRRNQEARAAAEYIGRAVTAELIKLTVEEENR